MSVWSRRGGGKCGTKDQKTHTSLIPDFWVRFHSGILESLGIPCFELSSWGGGWVSARQFQLSTFGLAFTSFWLRGVFGGGGIGPKACAVLQHLMVSHPKP